MEHIGELRGGRMQRRAKTFLPGAAMYLIGLVLVIIGAVVMGAGRIGLGVLLMFLGVVYYGSMVSYFRKQKRKREMREAYIEAQEDLAKRK